MRICCVPFCKSVREKPGEGRYPPISFHEIPSDLELREAWIKAIARIDPETNEYWIPRGNPCVCNLHFTPDQFIITPKMKRLKPGSVPCIFPGYPKYLLQSSTIKRFESLASKNADIISSINTKTFPNVIKGVNHCSLNDVNSNEECNEMQQVPASDIMDITVNIAVKNYVHTEEIHRKSDSHPYSVTDITERSLSKQCTNNFELVNSSTNSSKILSPETSLNVHSSMQSCDRTVQNNSSFTVNNTDHINMECDSGVNAKKKVVVASIIKKNAKNSHKSAQSNHEYVKSLQTKLASAERRIRRYKVKMLKLEEDNKKIQLVNEIMSEKIKNYNIEELEKAIEKDAKALFLVDQLRSFTKKNILWSQNTVKFFKRLKEGFPKSYNFLKQTDIISLPCSKILRYNHEEMGDDDSD